MKTQGVEQFGKIGAPVTVTEESDGTFFVRIDGKPFTRWPTMEVAERRADAVRRYDAQHAAN